jgi:indole-3-glycerol phosphate synthase
MTIKGKQTKKRTTMNDSKLDDILSACAARMARRQEKTPLPAVIALADMQTRPNPTLNIINPPEKPLIIGHIRLDDIYDPVASALRLARMGIFDGVTLFTDSRIYSRGAEDLLLVCRAMKQMPVISQNYILNVYGLLEARANGASGVILHADLLQRGALRELVSLSHRLKMTSIVRVNTVDQMAWMDEVAPHAVCIGHGLVFNAERDLPHLHTLRAAVPFHVRLMAYGYITRIDDLEALLNFGVHAVQISEKLALAPRHRERLCNTLDHYLRVGV